MPQSRTEESAARFVGCALPWYEAPQLNLSRCTSLKQFQKYEDYYWEASVLEQRDALSFTGCKLPCRYREFQEVGRPLKARNVQFGFGLGISIVSTDITVKTEELVYPLESFVSEFGGALGLFLGFSFLMVWDAAFLIFQFCKSFEFP